MLRPITLTLEQVNKLSNLFSSASFFRSHFFLLMSLHLFHFSFSPISLLISVPSLGVYYFFCRWLCLSVCHKHWFFFFASRWNRAISWPSVLHDKNYKMFFDFWFRPPNAQNLLPKICAKSPISLWVTEAVMVGINGSWVWVMDCGSTKFGLGAEIQSPTGLSITSSLYIQKKNMLIRNGEKNGAHLTDA